MTTAVTLDRRAIKLETLIKGMAPPIQEYLETYTKQARAKIEALETRIAALEDRRGMSYAGIWQSGASYARDAVVTHNGALWIAQTALPHEKPGHGGQWKMITKSGDR